MLPKLEFLLILVAAVLQICSGASIKQHIYANEETLDGEGRYLLRWDVVQDTIEFQVEAETLGFVGFGISPSGTMTGADIFIAGVRTDGSTYGQDFHATGETTPILDTQQDWRLLEAYELTAENKTILKFSRLLNTCDEQDFAIGNDTSRIIWALGATDSIGYHGATNRGTKSMNLVHATTPELDVSTLQNYTIAVNITMPAIDTAYWCTFHKGPTLTGKHHIVAFDTLLPSLESFQHTHHFVVYTCKAPGNQTDEEAFDRFTYQNGNIGDHCFTTQELPIAQCQSVIYTWAKGGKMMIFPEDVGFPIGETPTAEYYMVEIHYDNPQLLEGVLFETGLAMYHTPDLRPIDAGILALGQYVDVSLTVPPNQDAFKVVGHCSPQCTQEALEPEGITVFASMLHSHKSGRKMRTRHFRGNVELPWIDFDNQYDFDFQQNKILLETRQILPGDQMSVECTYSSVWRRGDPVIGGHSTYEEMCQNLLWYYPRVGLGCMSRYDVDTHLADFGVETYHTVQEASSLRYIIDTPVSIAGDYFDLVATKFNWTEEFLRAYQEERLNGDQMSHCGTQRPTRYPDNFVEYVPEDECAMKE
ncbi:DBH-like monooxygenase protein 1 homolog [Folsomia candida]|uniref:DBH-like monooxygenase protein 1 n=1 Tax=Folsomia candida TaxID=158441 RepID=A0A226DY34_FOLCA|nr:DBH-like monooxygenase protein 1 homolog [Folsomia candida]OXA49591.1 DBH-like monooxygenase protein 1 [Folsomia candida]